MGASARPARVARSEATTPTAEKTAKEPARENAARSQRAERAADRRRTGGQSSGTQRRRQPPRRAPLPAAKRELLISVDIGEQRVAVIEDDRVAEVYLERPERRSIAGNIYLGVVDNVLPGMEAAFVEIGLEKNGFLYVDEIVVPELEGKRHHGKKIQDLISRGEQLLVQAVKDPMKTKGARLTTEISLPGRFLVYVPNGEGLGVSRRLEDAERARLKDIIKGLEVKEGGVIVRTAAEGASAEDVERDLVFLQRLWKTIQARAKGASAPTLVYQEAELPLRIVRDLFAGDFVSAQVDNERTHKRIVSYLKKTSPHMIERVHRYKEKESLFESSGVEKEIASTLDRRVDLPSGGYLVFDYAEAFTVIDVNTGRFVGSRSKNSNQRLEDTITKNNLEAVKEVVRQLRLRDIGGIIVIDFIDMANPKNRASVEDALRQELERDRTKTYVVEISPLGLVEMTRQNVTDGPREILTRKCPTCAGDGIVVSDHTVAMQIERKLRALAAPGNRVQAYKVALHPRVLELLVGSGRLSPRRDRGGDPAPLLPRAGGRAHPRRSLRGRRRGQAGRPAAVLAARRRLDRRAEARRGRPVRRHGGRRQDRGRRRASSRMRRSSSARRPPSRSGACSRGRRLRRSSPPATPARGRSRSRARPRSRRALRPSASRRPLRTVTTVTRQSSPRRTMSRLSTNRSTPTPTTLQTTSRQTMTRPEIEAGEPGADGVTPAKKRTRRGSRGGRRRRKPAGAGVAADGAVEDGAAEAGADDGTTDVDAVAEPAAADEAEAAANGAVTDEPKAPQAKTPGRRRTTRIHVPGDPDAPAVAPEVLQEAIAETPVEAVEAPRRDARRRARAEDDTVSEADANGAAAARRRRRPGRRQAQDAPRQPWRQEPPQEAGRSRGRARRGRGRDRGRRRGGGCRRRDRERRVRDRPDRRGRGRHRDRARAGPGGRDGAGRRADPRGGRAVSGRVRGSGLRADVRVARRFRPQMMAAFRYTPSACGHLPAFSAPESTLP